MLLEVLCEYIYINTKCLPKAAVLVDLLGRNYANTLVG